MDKITIIIPVYNVEKYMLIQCLDSILNQTYKNIELIIVDDGSKQDVADLCEEYRASHSHFDIKVVHNRNGGASVARNTGIEISTGAYITFVDADDWIDDDYVEQLYKKIVKSNADIVMCSRVFEFKSNSKHDSFFDKDKVFSSQNKKELIRKSITTGVAGTWCKLYRREFLVKNNLKYDKNLRRTQDIIFNLYAFQKADKIIYFNKSIYHYRMQNESVTKKYNSNADDILTRAAVEFRKFAEEFYPEDEDILQDVYYKCLIIFNEILKLKFFNSKYSKSRKHKYEEIELLSSAKIYSEAMKKISGVKINRLMKLRIFLIKNSNYILLELLYFLQRLIEKRRNFS